MAELVNRIDGLRPVDCGPSKWPGSSSPSTALIISINVRNKVRAGIKITGLNHIERRRSSCLAGGTGGAKLARGMLDVVGADALAVIANTGDDIEIYGAYVSPDPDLVTFWLADRIDERGWGLAGDTFHVMDGLRRLGDRRVVQPRRRDLAIGIERARRLRAGRAPDGRADRDRKAPELRGRVLPMSDSPVRTRVMAADRWWPFQEFMIRPAARAPVEDVDFRGAADARPSPEVLEAIATARAIVIGPSNPVISIGPILAVPGIRAALQRQPSAPVVAVSPLVAGEVVKGPTARVHGVGRPAAVE